jgi:hypothetical protein
LKKKKKEKESGLQLQLDAMHAPTEGEEVGRRTKPQIENPSGEATSRSGRQQHACM